MYLAVTVYFNAADAVVLRAVLVAHLLMKQ